MSKGSRKTSHRKPGAVLEVSDFEVASWSPGAEGAGVPCTQVHIVYQVPGLNLLTFVLRLKSREVTDNLIAALIEHRDFVFGQGELKQ